MRRKKNMSREEIGNFEQLARRLRGAYGATAVAPLRDGLDPADGVGAYTVQDINTRFWASQGRRIVGRKIGLTAKAVQAQLGVDQPDYGVLFADMQIADRGVLPASRVIQPKAEAEIALILKSDISAPDASRADVLAAAECAVAAIEIVDSRIADWKITFADTVADNGSSAFFVLGEERKSFSRGWISIHAAWCWSAMARSPRSVLARLASTIR